MDTSSPNNLHNETINLHDIVNTVVKYWYLFAISVVCCVAIAFFYSKISKPKYVVVSNVMIRTDMSSSGNMAGAFMQQMGLGNLMGQGVSVDDELHIISSHSLFRETAVEMELNKLHIHKENFFDRWLEFDNYAVDVIDPSMQCDTLGTTLIFKVKIDEEGLADIKVVKGFFKTLAEEKDVQLPATINTAYGEYIVTSTPHYQKGEKYNYTIRVSGYDMTAENLSREVAIYLPDKMSNMITLCIETPYISYGKNLLNNITRLYNERGIKEKNIEATNSAIFINERLAIIAAELDTAERKVEAYKKTNDLSDIEIEARAILENDVMFRNKLLEAETQSKVLDYVLEFVSDPQNRFALIPFTTGLSESSSKAITAYNELALQHINMRTVAKEGSPALTLLEKQIDASRENVITTIHTAKESSDIALRDLREQENKYLDRIRTMPTQEREFISIYRQKTIKEELYIFLLQKQEENALTLAMASPKGQIVDQAFNLNEPSSLSTKMLLLIGFIIGIIIPAVFLYLRALFRTKFSSKEELERITRIPILGEICVNRTNESIVVREGENSPISELFRLLRTNLQFLLTGKNDKVILLTSSVSGEGKSFVSTNLAATLSLLNKRVVLIGLDIRNPRLSDYIKIRSKYGVTNYLASEDISIDNIIVNTGITPQLDVILAGPVPPNPAELLLSNRLDKLFEELRSRYDYIIIDSAPVAMVSDTFSLTRVADTIVYVCRANYTNRDYIRYCNTLVAEERLRNVSLVINATTAKQGYGYGYNQKGERVKVAK